MNTNRAIRFVLLSVLVSFAGVMRPAAGPPQKIYSQTALFNQLITAIRAFDMVAVLRAIGDGVNINQVGSDGYTPLNWALNIRNNQVINLVQEYGGRALTDGEHGSDLGEGAYGCWIMSSDSDEEKFVQHAESVYGSSENSETDSGSGMLHDGAEYSDPSEFDSFSQYSGPSEFGSCSQGSGSGSGTFGSALSDIG